MTSLSCSIVQNLGTVDFLKPSYQHKSLEKKLNFCPTSPHQTANPLTIYVRIECEKRTIVTLDSTQQQSGNRMRIRVKRMTWRMMQNSRPRNGKLTKLSTFRHLFWVALICSRKALVLCQYSCLFFDISRSQLH